MTVFVQCIKSENSFALKKEVHSLIINIPLCYYFLTHRWGHLVDLQPAAHLEAQVLYVLHILYIIYSLYSIYKYIQ